VFGLSLYTTERELKDIFSKYGPIEDVQVVYDRQTGRSRGFAFVYYDEIDDAREAKEKTNGVEVDGRRIRVDFSITKRPHTPTPGIYMGKPTRPRDADYESSRYSPSPYGSRRRSRSPSYSPRQFQTGFSRHFYVAFCVIVSFFQVDTRRSYWCFLLSSDAVDED
jgi:transformer-2 protein